MATSDQPHAWRDRRATVFSLLSTAATRPASASTWLRSTAAPAEASAPARQRAAVAIGAGAHLARGGESVVAAAAERGDGFGQRLDLAVDGGDAAGQARIARRRPRGHDRGFERVDPAHHFLQGAAIDAGRGRAAREVAHFELEAGEPGIDRAHAVVAAGEQSHGAEHGEDNTGAGDAGAKHGHARRQPAPAARR